jgi:hypothetical protein
MVVRDESGAVLQVEWQSLKACGSTEEAKTLACLDGIRYLIGSHVKLSWQLGTNLSSRQI